MTTKFQQGFQSQLQQQTGIKLPIEGSFPDWLAGTLIRNVPSMFDFSAHQCVNHWFDGLSMLHRFAFHEGEVTYACKFLESKAFTSAQSEGRLCSREFGTDPDMSVIDRAVAVFQQQFTDNANVNVAKFADDAYVALTETPTVTQFEPHTLDTVAQFKFDDRLPGQITTAHPHFDYTQNCLFNLLTHIAAASSYQIYKLPYGSRQRSLVATIPVKEPAYIHSFGMTEKYIVLTEIPFLLNPSQLLFSGKPYVQNYHWQPNKETLFHVVDKDSGKTVARVAGAPCFAFHHVNAFERDREVVIDLLVYADAGIVSALSLRNLRNCAAVPTARLQRITINLDNKSVGSENICEQPVELPRINYAACNSSNYSFAYCSSGLSEDNFLDRLIKINLSNGEVKFWQEDGCYPGEPVFVWRSKTSPEDDGVVISMVLDTTSSTTFLLLLDAASMEEHARVRLPHVVPFGFHGQFFRD